MASLGHTVDTDGVTGDYSSLNALEAAQQQDLTDGGGDTYTATCQATTGVADTTAVTFVGWTTASGGDITIIAAAGHEAVKSSWDTSRYRLETANAVALGIREDYVTVQNLQIGKSAGSANDQYVIEIAISINASNAINILNCRVKDANSSYRERSIFINDADAIVTIENTMVYNVNTTHGFSYCIAEGASTSINIYNCDLFGSNYSINQASGTVTAKNCAIGNYNGGATRGTVTLDYSCSDDGTGTNAQTPSGASWNNEKTSVSTGNFTALSGGNIINNGVGPSSDANVPATDIDGDTRSGTTCDIGVDEYIAAGGNAPTGVFYGPLVGPFGGPI